MEAVKGCGWNSCSWRIRDRGVQGKIVAAMYARENRVPYLGICLGMQIAVIEFARSILGLPDANSTEFDPMTENPCVIFMPEVFLHCLFHSCLRHASVRLLIFKFYGTVIAFNSLFKQIFF